MNNACLLISSWGLKRLFARGIAEIATFLESKGYPVRLLPLGFYLHSNQIKNKAELENKVTAILKEAIKDMKPKFVGVSNSFTADYPDCLKIIEICKKIKPDIVTIIGGPHVTFLDEACLRDSPFVDIVVRGEGEWTMTELLYTINRKRDLSRVKGIAYRENGNIIRTPPRPLGNLDEIPPVNFELFPEELIKKAFIYGMLNRGCMFNCSYCVERAFWIKRRSFKVRRLISEMKQLENKYKNTIKAIDDSMLDMRSRQFFELCHSLSKEKIAFPGYIQSHVNRISEEGIKAISKAGIKRVYLGIESASPKVLRMMNKNITLRQVFSDCEKLKRKKISVGSFWIIGHPGDNPKEASYSLRIFHELFSRQLIQEACIEIFVPLPGTRFYNQPKEFGIEILTYDWREWRRPYSRFNRPIHRLQDFSAEEITHFYRKSLNISYCHKTINSL